MLYGDTSKVLGDGGDILELIGEEQEDPRGQFGVKKHSVIIETDVGGLHSKGVSM